MSLSILIQDGTHKGVLSLSCINYSLDNFIIMGNNHIGVCQGLLNRDFNSRVNSHIHNNGTIVGFEEEDFFQFRQIGVLYPDHVEVHHGSEIQEYFAHMFDENILIIGNRIKNQDVYVGLFNSLQLSKGSILERLVSVIRKNKQMGMDRECLKYGLSCCSLSLSIYDYNQNLIHRQSYIGTDKDPIDMIQL